MRLTDEFAIATAPDRAYALLLDLPRVAPCIPGGEIGEPDADGVYPGRVSVKLGPMRFVYDGKVRIAERDPAARTALITGEGRASGGGRHREDRHDDGGHPRRDRVPRADDDRPRDQGARGAQMGQGVIADVSRRLVKEAAACIEARLVAADDADPSSLPTAKPVAGISLMASVMGAKVGDSVRRLGGRGGTTDADRKGADDAPR